MKTVVTGAKGQLGTDVFQRLKAIGITPIGVDLVDFDITNPSATLRALEEYRPDNVIHCAAYTAVDKAEKDADLCAAINVDGTRHIAMACHNLDIPMIYISTDYVFNGKGDTPFPVDAPKAPLNVYGRTKLEGELQVQAMLTKYFIVRISWVFGLHGSNFVKTMLRLGKERESLDVVSDQIGSPTFTRDLSVLLGEMIQTDQYGVYHATNEGFCSWYEFAQKIMTYAGLPCEVHPIASTQYATPAARPLNSRLSKESLDAGHFSRLPHWQDALQRYMVLLRQAEVAL